jgi:uncharacterized protein YacL
VYYKVRHYISKISTEIFIFCILYLLQRLLLEPFLSIKIVLFKAIYLHELLLLISSFVLLKLLFKVSSPYKKFLTKQ